MASEDQDQPSRRLVPVSLEATPIPLRVIVVDIDVPFGTLVSLWIRITLAAIPAFLLMFAVVAFLGAITWDYLRTRY